MSDFLNMLRGRGLLSDIDVAFARFIGRNANGDAALTLLAAIISNRIGTRESLRKYLKTISAASENETQNVQGAETPLDLGFLDRMDHWPPLPDAFPHLFSEYRPGSNETFRPTPLILANGLYYLGRAFQN